LGAAWRDIDNAFDGADGGDIWAVEAAHNFSKRTKIYGTWVDADTDKSGVDDTFTVGLKHSF